MLRLLLSHALGSADRADLDQRGYLVLPGALAPQAREALIEALTRVAALQLPYDQGRKAERQPGAYAAEHEPLLASWIAHPELLGLARWALGSAIRFDHCVALNRRPSNRGVTWHNHEYADAEPRLGFLRIFFYPDGFAADDGGLGVVPGSHAFRDSGVRADGDAQLEAGWLAGKCHPATGEPLRIERLSAPPATVILMWTHLLHAVTPRRSTSPTRLAVVYGYRNPGRPSASRWITEKLERDPPPGAKGLMSLY